MIYALQHSMISLSYHMLLSFPFLLACVYFVSKSITSLQARSCVCFSFSVFFFSFLRRFPHCTSSYNSFVIHKSNHLWRWIQKTVSTETHRTNVNPTIRITHSYRELLLHSLTDFQGFPFGGTPFSSLFKRIHSTGKDKKSVRLHSPALQAHGMKQVYLSTSRMAICSVSFELCFI